MDFKARSGHFVQAGLVLGEEQPQPGNVPVRTQSPVPAVVKVQLCLQPLLGILGSQNCSRKAKAAPRKVVGDEDEEGESWA